MVTYVRPAIGEFRLARPSIGTAAVPMVFVGSRDDLLALDQACQALASRIPDGFLAARRSAGAPEPGA